MYRVALVTSVRTIKIKMVKTYCVWPINKSLWLKVQIVKSGRVCLWQLILNKKYNVNKWLNTTLRNTLKISMSTLLNLTTIKTYIQAPLKEFCLHQHSNDLHCPVLLLFIYLFTPIGSSCIFHCRLWRSYEVLQLAKSCLDFLHLTSQWNLYQSWL